MHAMRVARTEECPTINLILSNGNPRWTSRLFLVTEDFLFADRTEKMTVHMHIYRAEKGVQHVIDQLPQTYVFRCGSSILGKDS